MANPAMRKGAPSVNPSGRPAGFKGLSQKIRKETRDGAELVDFALAILRADDETLAKHNILSTPKTQTRWEALQWLADRGFGRAVTPIDLTTNEGVAPRVAFGALSLEELEVMERVALRGVASAEPIDVDGDDETSA